MVAIDDAGNHSGPSDYAEATRPFIHSKPPETATAGKEYRYQVTPIRSLGDLRLRVIDGKEVASFWDIEKPRYSLIEGPSWLSIDADTGLLRGVPTTAGTADITIKVTLERTVRRLDPARLSWGQELVKETVIEKVGSTTQKFKVEVGEK